MEDILCTKCNVHLELIKCKFKYLNTELYSEVPRCPKCKQVYLSEELVKERIHEVEASLEGK